MNKLLNIPLIKARNTRRQLLKWIWKHIIHEQDVIAARAIDHLKLKHPALITTIHGSLTKEIKEQFFQDPLSKLENLSYFKNLEYTG
ncbi:hypothetical protein [Cytobacillus kochii]|uniref:hypothetical protein n=1 Tax=Cytobacillus kochii TaxID=859143 RepID=UPI00203EF36B|nr:hypothetical protein [Cytobacillus kochii]MCM3321510.1 hypothetical protein [Cytobacillus kochii]MCM3343656.1 hypothetical protein [Cytobacillus kochii]